MRRLTWIAIAITLGSAPGLVGSTEPAAEVAVYVEEIAAPMPFPAAERLRRFSGYLIELRLRELQGVRVERETVKQATARIGCPRDFFYRLRGNIYAVGKRAWLQYSLFEGRKTSASCLEKQLIARTIELPEAATLSQLNQVADELAARIEREALSRGGHDLETVEVLDVRVGSLGNSAESIAEGVRGFMGSFLRKDPGVELFDASTSPGVPDYRIRAEVTTPRSLNPIRGFERLTLDAEFELELTGGESYPLIRVTESASMNETEFSLLAAREAVRRFARVREALAAGEDALLDLAVDDLIEQGRELLCRRRPVRADCISNPSAAAAAAEDATRQDPERADSFQLLGEAAFEAGDYARAGVALDEALRLGQAPGDRSFQDLVALLDRSGEAWFRAQEYSEAAERFTRSLELAGAQDIERAESSYLGGSRSLRLSGRMQRALELLIRGLREYSHSADLKEELILLVWNMNELEIEKAEELLNSDAAEPARSVAMPHVLVSSGLWLRDSQGKFPEAVDAIQRGLAEQSTSIGVYSLAETHFLWANHLAGHTGPASSTEDVRARDQYQTASEEVLPVLGVYEGSGYILREANHVLDKNRETRTILRSHLDSDPANGALLEDLMWVCGEYLADFDCALDAGLSLMAVSPRLDPSWTATIAEAEVRVGRYVDARAGLADLLDAEPPERLRAVALFYLYWSLQGMGQSEAAGRAHVDWSESVGRLQARGEETGWYFGGSRDALVREEGLSDETVHILAKMLDEMGGADGSTSGGPLEPVGSGSTTTGGD